VTDATLDVPIPDSALSGEDRMTQNVLASWTGQIVVVITGFLVPRLIDDQLGQTALGIWDLAWSTVHSFRLVQMGIVSSISRYISRYRAVGDIDGVNRTVSSVSCVLTIMAAIIMGLAVATAFSLPRLLDAQLGTDIGTVRWLIVLLGASLAVQTGSHGFAGVLTGYHRWGLHNAIQAGSQIIVLAGMLGVLFAGYGLPALALVVLGGELVSRITQSIVAYRIFPDLRVRIAHIRWSYARQMIIFGSKSFVPTIAKMVLAQATSLQIVGALGPAGLALYSRPMALIRHVATYSEKLANVLTPTVSSLQSTGHEARLRALLISASRYSAYIALPAVLTLSILGGTILRLWMGSGYDKQLLVAILAVGHLTFLVQQPVEAIMIGLNAHGRLGLAKVVTSACSVAAMALALGPMGQGLVAVSLAVAVPTTLANGIYVPFYACRRLKLPVGRYLVETWKMPLLCCAPFALCLGAGRWLLSDRPLMGLLSGGVAGGLVLGWLYWRHALPPGLKERIGAQMWWRMRDSHRLRGKGLA
jgi:O-antigen/teichoic acid export membrane protein